MDDGCARRYWLISGAQSSIHMAARPTHAMRLLRDHTGMFEARGEGPRS